MERLETTVTVTQPTQFTLTANDSVNGQIYFEGALVFVLRSSTPTWIARAVGDYTVVMIGRCQSGQICTSIVADPPSITAPPTPVNSDVLIDCEGATEVASVNQVVSIAGSERPINVRVVEQCSALDGSDYELVCASTDGRVLMINTTSSPPELVELDGSVVTDSATAVNCDVEYVTVDKCFENDTDPSIKFNRITTYPVGSPSDAVTIWLDSSGLVIPAPSDVVECSEVASDCQPLPASGVVCYVAQEEVAGGCGSGNNFVQTSPDNYETTIVSNGNSYTMQITVAPAGVSSFTLENCNTEPSTSPSAPHPSFVTLQGGDVTATLVFTPPLPTGESFDLTFLGWGNFSPVTFSTAPDSSTPDVPDDPRTFTWNDASDLNNIDVLVGSESNDVHISGQFGLAQPGEVREAFVFHDCDGVATYRDVETNNLLVAPTLTPCRTFDESPVTDTITYGQNNNVPAGAKSVVITRLSETVVLDGSFQLGSSPLPQSISFDATQTDGVTSLLPGISLSGGTWQWAAVIPTVVTQPDLNLTESYQNSNAISLNLT